MFEFSPECGLEKEEKGGGKIGKKMKGLKEGRMDGPIVTFFL